MLEQPAGTPVPRRARLVIKWWLDTVGLPWRRAGCRISRDYLVVPAAHARPVDGHERQPPAIPRKPEHRQELKEKAGWAT